MGVPSRARTAPYCLRLSVAERRVLEAAAAQRQEHLAEYLRGRALEAARRDLVTAREVDPPPPTRIVADRA